MPAKGVTIISKLRSSLHEKMEKLLMVWVTEKQLKGDTLTQGIICEKAQAIYGDLLNRTPRTRHRKTRLKLVEAGLTTLEKGPAFTPLSGMVRQQVRM
ncbi:hypothetical protein AVEN_162481-1 [Araneus ventricosus]|uniref:HTH CENPB-type domain-containing protein n=1 Tax=Araneus ventricosus TaxID=182803 RepID=A0A4Y2ASV0_ARAVE|nr:hypothetical protein AVEN_228658-1 [Araneus ventricosus]GBL82773.1 hypothetical protein AVEN_275308-1 [Araneus ventricosus]GBL82788.1 hypothetical protein AVEN_31636-1 [Araneus ventricosus]GBL82815.1 hypothetical protein AVEN_162481-1 [Araneus ventricosus]